MELSAENAALVGVAARYSALHVPGGIAAFTADQVALGLGVGRGRGLGLGLGLGFGLGFGLGAYVYPYPYS